MRNHVRRFRFTRPPKRRCLRAGADRWRGPAPQLSSWQTTYSNSASSRAQSNDCVPRAVRSIALISSQPIDPASLYCRALHRPSITECARAAPRCRAPTQSLWRNRKRMGEGMAGYYRMPRGEMDDPVFAGEPYSRRDAFRWLVENAMFRPRMLRINGHEIEVKRGQLCISTRRLAIVWGWHEARVRRRSHQF